MKPRVRLRRLALAAQRVSVRRCSGACARHRSCAALAIAFWFAMLTSFVSHSQAATAPYVRLLGQVGTRLDGADGCGPANSTPVFRAEIDLGPDGSYRYSPAWVVAFYFDDEGEFNRFYNNDAVLEISPYVHAPRSSMEFTLPTTMLSSWLAAFGRVPEHSQLALRVAAYDRSGAAVSMSRITWDCTTGQVLSLEQRGNASAPPNDAYIEVVEFYHAFFDHYFMTADAGEIAALDRGTMAGWTRTGRSFRALASGDARARPVCRFYLPPANGDSHFFSVSPQECDAVAAAFPGFVKETANAFYAGLPDAASGRCAADELPVYRLWNNRADSNHRYTSDAATKAAMVARGFIAEGYGPDAVSLCARE